MRPENHLTVSTGSFRRDGWKSLLTGIGDMYRDKRMSAVQIVYRLTREELRALWLANDMGSNIVEKFAAEQVRKWLDVKVEGDKEAGEAFDARLEELGAQRKFQQALEFERAYGGSAILVGVNDRSDLAGLVEPLHEDRIQSVDYLNVFEARDLPALEYYDNPLEAKYGEVKIFGLTPRLLGLSGTGLIAVHESRLLVFDGSPISLEDRIANRGWGDSVLNRCHGAIRDLGLSWESAAALLQDFAQAVFKIKGLAEAVGNDRDELVIKRLQLMDISRSALRGIALDADGEDFERKPTPISGLAEILDRLCNRLAAAARMPVTLLMGQSPAGLNATGDSDIRWFYDLIESLQKNRVRPQVEKLVRILALTKNGPTNGVEPENWSIEFRPLWQLDAVQESTIRVNIATADEKNIANGVYSPEEASSHYSGDKFSLDVQLDRKARERFAADPLDGTETPRLLKPDPNQVDPENPSPEPVDATKPGVDPLAPGADGKAQDIALNGAQVTAALEIVSSVANGELPRDAAIGMLIEFFNRTPEGAERILGSVGKGFEPKKPDPQPAPGPAPLRLVKPVPGEKQDDLSSDMVVSMFKSGEIQKKTATNLLLHFVKVDTNTAEQLLAA